MENSELSLEEAIAHVEACLEYFNNVFDQNGDEPLPWLADVGIKEVVKAAEPHVPPRYPAAKIIDEYWRDQQLKEDDRKKLTVNDLLLMFKLILEALHNESSGATEQRTNESRPDRPNYPSAGTPLRHQGFLPKGKFPKHHQSFAVDHSARDRSDEPMTFEIPIR
jgi:hypothetical protein